MAARACARGVAALAVASLLEKTLAESGPSRADLTKRASIGTSPTALAGQTFDYVIVGGGTAGLVVASRLSEDPATTVAVIEAGTDGTEAADSILPPAQAYFNGIANIDSEYDWHYMSTNQTNLNGQQHFWARGKVLGGSSAVNGGYMVRMSEIEHNSWASLIGSPSKWGWDRVFPFMKKSERFTPSQSELLDDLVHVESAHGTDGPIHYSYPGFVYPQIGSWIETLANNGIDTRDPLGGETWGAQVATSCIDPTTFTRSYSKTGYIDGLAAGRNNLVILTRHQATKIVFEGTTAKGVQFAAAAGGQVYTVSARREVILSAGVMGSPHLLQLSGVGDAALLESLNIPLVKDLPGVGQHLTDHVSSALVFSASPNAVTGDAITTNPTFAAEQFALWEARDPSSLYNAPNDALAYVNLSTIFGGAESAATFIAEAQAELDAQATAYSPNEKVQAGFRALFNAELRDVYPSPVGAVEILLSNTGSYGRFGEIVNTISIQCAAQHPLSRGRLAAVSADPFVLPQFDPGYLTVPTDIKILRQGFKFARQVAGSAPLRQFLDEELVPGPDVVSDEQWEDWIRSSSHTEYHPSSTCSMLPEDQGGVVDEDLRVYGVSNLRIVDASIVPVGTSSHLMAPMYGIAEAAVDLIRSGSTSSPASTRSGSSTSPTSSSSATPQTDGAPRMGISTALAVISLLAMLFHFA